MSAQIDDIQALKHIVEAKLPLAPGLAVRTVESDLQHIVDLQQEFGIPIKAEAFLGCSRIRQMVEEWDLSFLLKSATKAVKFAKAHDMPIMFVTEDTTRALIQVISELSTVQLLMLVQMKSVSLIQSVIQRPPGNCRG